MKKVIIAITIIGVTILLIKIGDILLSYTNDNYRAKKQSKTYNSRIAEFKKEEIAKFEDTICQLRLSLISDTLEFEIKDIQKEYKGYSVQFLYPKFNEKSTEISRLNKEMKLMVFDELSDSKSYFSKNKRKFIEEFKDVKEDEKYEWRDLEELELTIYNNKFFSGIDHDFELKSGGAIWFGDMIGFNFDLENGKKITFEELFDKTKLDVLQNELKNSYKNQFEVELLNENGWDKEEIPISKNFFLDKEGINFIYQRFEYNGVGGSGLNINIPYCKLINLLNEGSIIKRELV